MAEEIASNILARGMRGLVKAVAVQIMHFTRRLP